MRRDLERRLQLIEFAGAGAGGIRIWIDQGDGTVRSVHGEQSTRKEIEALRQAGEPCLIVISEVDARL